MKYINANEILPDVLVKELQKYVQAGYIYIPVKNEQHKSWGELSGIEKSLKGAIKLSLKNTAEVFLLRNLRTNIIFRYML